MSAAKAAFIEKVKEQEWFQQLQNSYEQLPPEQQTYVKWGGLGMVLIIAFYLTWNMVLSANELKHDYYEKQETLRLVNSAGEEIRRLKGQNAGFAPQGSQNWKAIFQSVASNQGLPADSVEVTREAPATGSTLSSGVIQESLLDVQVKSAPLRPLVQFLYQIEHGNPPMKLKSLQVETGSDGTLSAKLSVSGFLPKPEKK